MAKKKSKESSAASTAEVIGNIGFLILAIGGLALLGSVLSPGH